jgi:hypothetical protein
MKMKPQCAGCRRCSEVSPKAAPTQAPRIVYSEIEKQRHARVVQLKKLLRGVKPLKRRGWLCYLREHSLGQECRVRFTASGAAAGDRWRLHFARSGRVYSTQ